MPSSQSSFSILILSAGLKAISWIEKFAVNGYWELYEPAGGNANPSNGTEDFEEGRITENADNPLERNDPLIPSPFGHLRCQRGDGVNPVAQFAFLSKNLLFEHGSD